MLGSTKLTQLPGFAMRNNEQTIFSIIFKGKCLMESQSLALKLEFNREFFPIKTFKKRSFQLKLPVVLVLCQSNFVGWSFSLRFARPHKA
jgi:hypothetical protein